MSEIVVVKLGGTTIADQRQVLEEVAAFARTRPVVLVHGGGRRITDWLERLGVPSRFEGGLRVTDAAALEVAAALKEIAGRRYSAEWNIYAAQASDGDAFGADAGKSAHFLAEQVLPLARYYAYIETPPSADSRTSPLWAEYEEIENDGHFAMRRVSSRDAAYSGKQSCWSRRR